MAQITLNIPDDKITLVIDAMCFTHDYTGVAQPGETKAQFAKRMLAADVNNLVRSYISSTATDVDIT